MLDTIAAGFEFFLLITLLAKLFEIGCHLVAAIQGRQYARELSKAVGKWKTEGFKADELRELRLKHRWPGSLAEWPITRHLLRLPNPVRRLILNYLFRYRSLMPLQAVVVAFSSNRLVVGLGVLSLFVGAWLEILRILADRLVFGYADSYFNKTMPGYIGSDDSLRGAEIPATRQERVQDFVKLFCGLVVVLILSYAAIYSGMDTLAQDGKPFSNVCDDWTKPLQFLYFSVVTVATVGYGDIVPANHCLVARLVAASEIMAGFTLLVLFLTSFQLTFEPE